ncbi:Beta-ribofuranosylaminobenzene 5'-phosphate synthase [Candidatus Methanoperedenaceae archaeon GB37]|nr:Beta-ribofuranosylaminobenzene 5'-phosphate synthase [Candidatus Methanoperedenaceae archaeon GB37]
MIRIVTPSRLHLTLIDLNASIGRVDGGVGIALEEPRISIVAEPAATTVVSGNDLLGERMKRAVKAVHREAGLRIQIEESYPAHVGLGSGTQAALAAGTAVSELCDLHLDAVEVGRRVGRGGTSGIGIAAFERGGFILDGGHRFADKMAFSPSSASNVDPAPLLLHHDFPDWEIVLAIPDVKGASSREEVDIFRRVCPIPLRDVQALSHVILMKMLPAVVERDFEAFSDAVNRVQEIGFKRHEISLQREEVRELMRVMRDAGGEGVGMSSFGPTVYALTDAPRDVQMAAQEFLDRTIGGRVILTHARNQGATISSL